MKFDVAMVILFLSFSQVSRYTRIRQLMKSHARCGFPSEKVMSMSVAFLSLICALSRADADDVVA